VSVRAEIPRRSDAGPPAQPAERSPLEELLTVLGIAPTELATVFDRLRLPAYVFDRDARIRWFNCYARALFGDLVGRNALRYVAPEHLPRAREQFARKLVGGVPTEFDLEVFDAEGGRVHLRISSVPLRSRHAVVGVFGVAIPAVIAAANEAPAFALTARQRDVLRLLDEGLGTHELAAQLGISVETARNHVRALLRELGVHSRLEAVAVARRHGLLPPSSI
jgi:PAS domain S-box-containing protein